MTHTKTSNNLQKFDNNHHSVSELTKQYQELLGNKSEIRDDPTHDINDLSQPTPFKTVDTYTTYGIISFEASSPEIAK